MKATPPDELELVFHAAAGIAALIPGMRRMMELMQQEYERMQIKLAAAQGRMGTAAAPAKRGRPRKVATAAGGGWPADPAQRSREMKRRQAVARGEKKPRRAKPAQPSTLSIKRKATWAALSARQRKQRLAAMAAGKQKPVVKLAEAV